MDTHKIAQEYCKTYSPFTNGKEWKVEEILRQFSEYPVWPDIQCQAGWIDLIYQLHESLIQIYPEYKIGQVKEKFGTLRFYIDKYPTYGTTQNFIVTACIRHAENESRHICEQCGVRHYENGVVHYVEIRTMYGWHHVYCDACELIYIENIHARQTRELSTAELEYKQQILDRIQNRNNNASLLS